MAAYASGLRVFDTEDDATDGGDLQIESLLGSAGDGDLGEGLDEGLTEGLTDGLEGELEGDLGAGLEGEGLEEGLAGIEAQSGPAGPPPPEYRPPPPDNYRAPPVQNQTRRGPRVRPDIHAHPLLQSMDLSFVGNQFGGNNSGLGGLLGGGLGGLLGGGIGGGNPNQYYAQ